MTPPEPDHAPPPDTRLLDGLASHIALLDRRGRVIWTNRAWNRFGIDNDAPSENGVGTIYQRVCERTAEHADATDAASIEDARDMIEALHAVQRGDIEHHRRAYDCSSPAEHRVFQAQISAIELEGQRVTMVSHENITAPVEDARRIVRLASLDRLTNPTTAVGASAEMVAHELTNPVTALICTLAGARRLLGTGDAPDMTGLNEAIDHAIGYADRARVVLGALRSVSPAHRVSDRATDLARLTEAVIQTVVDDARHRAVRIEHDLAAAETRTDPTHAALVVLAMIRAAIRRACDSPLAARVVRVCTRTAGGLAQVSVAHPPPEPGRDAPLPDDDFGLGFARHTAETLGGTITDTADARVLSLPSTTRVAA